MAKITTADCKRVLDGLDPDFVRRCEFNLRLKRSDKWVRLRKYKDGQGVWCRDFLNTGVPAVIVLAEIDGRIEVKRERGLGYWEKAAELYFPDLYGNNWYDNQLWKTLRAEDFAFGVGGIGDPDDELDGEFDEPYYFFQPVTVTEGWDQHSGIDHLLIPLGFRPSEVVESTYLLGSKADQTAALVAAGFTHDRKLNNVSGS